MITIEIEGVDELLRDIDRAEAEIRRLVQQVINRYAYLIQREVRRLLSQPGRGRIYRAEQTVTINTGGRAVSFIAYRGRSITAKSKAGRAGVHRASAPGDPPAVDFGRLRASIAVELGRFTAAVIANTEYAAALEFGTRDGQLAARPFMLPAFEKYREAFIRDLAEALSAEIV